MRRTGTRTVRAAASGLAALALLAAAATPASAGTTFVPPASKIYTGVSDTGSKRHYFEFTREVGRHVPLMQSFETWGGVLKESKQRWRRTQTRGVLSLSTSSCYACEGVISPREIKLGFGDAYLLRLNGVLSDWGKPVYIRLLPEMNGHWNAYAAFNEDGSSRGAGQKTKQFRQAWKRSVIITRGGLRKKINRKLRAEGLPKLKRGKKPPKRVPRPDVSFMWVPQTHGSPDIRKNRPAAYWPGKSYVDWVGADIYGSFPNFDGLERFYRQRKNFPFVIGEWSPWNVDNPAFTNQLFEWAESHKRTKMLLYYQGFGDNNPFMLDRFPASATAMRKQMRNKRYKQFAPHARKKKGKGGGKGGGGGTGGGLGG